MSVHICIFTHNTHVETDSPKHKLNLPSTLSLRSVIRHLLLKHLKPGGQQMSGFNEGLYVTPVQKSNIGALIIRLGFWGPLHSDYNKPQNSIGNYLSPYSNQTPDRSPSPRPRLRMELEDEGTLAVWGLKGLEGSGFIVRGTKNLEQEA